MSRSFIITIILIILIGFGVIGYFYYAGKQELVQPVTPLIPPVRLTPKLTPSPTPSPTPVSIEIDLSNIEKDLKEQGEIQTETDLLELDEASKELNPANFDLL